MTINKQILNEFLQKKKNPGKKNINNFPNRDELAIGEVRTLKAAILVLDIANSSKISESDFIGYVSPILHMVFHITNQNEGVVDKYTGDGAMISFCDNSKKDNWACEMALTTALTISQLLIILKKDYKFPDIKIRIGIDFGMIKVEQIGVKKKTQLIIVGRPAIAAKRLESIAKKKVTYSDYSAICLGYDAYFNLSQKNKTFCKEILPPYSYCNYFRKIKSDYTKQKIYKIYEFIGRYPNK